MRELAVGDAAPEDGVGFGHVVAPEHHRVALFNIGVDVAGFVNAEGLIKAHNGGSHTEARIRVNVVGAEPSLHEFTGAVRFRNRVLAGTDDGDAFRTLCVVGAAQLFLHFVESYFPAHRLKAPVLVEFAVLLTHQGLREAVLAVENLGVEVTLNAVKTAVHRGFGVTLGGHDAAVEGADLQAAARAAEAADALLPADAGIGLGRSLRGNRRNGNTDGGGGTGGNTRLHKVSAG